MQKLSCKISQYTQLFAILLLLLYGNYCSKLIHFYGFTNDTTTVSFEHKYLIVVNHSTIIYHCKTK